MITAPSGQSILVKAPPTRSAPAKAGDDVSTSKAKKRAFWSVKLTPAATPFVLYTSSSLSSW